MTNPTQQLAELHELAKSCPGGVRGCEWWCQLILPTPMGPDYWMYGVDDQVSEILAEHVLDLITASAERWLKSHEDELVYCYREQGYISLEHGYDCFGSTLPEALKYAMEQTDNTKEKR